MRIHRWRSNLPLAFVLVSLLSLALVPVLVHRSTRMIRTEVTDVAEPARTQVREVLLGLALEAAGTRGYLLTGDARYVTVYEQARDRRRRAQAELLPLARRLDPRIQAGVEALNERLQRPDARLDSLFTGRIPRERFVARLPEQQAAFEQVVTIASDLDADLGRLVASRREQVDLRERIGAAAVTVLVVLALVAALLVAGLGRSYRSLAERLELRAREQGALRQIARDLGATSSAQGVAERVVEYAVAHTGASGAVVEGIDPSAPGDEVILLAMAGSLTPPHGARTTLEDSFTGAVEASRAAGAPLRPMRLDAPLPTYAEASCRGCSARVVPLRSEGRILGSLVLVRTGSASPDPDEEAAQLRTLADLASVSLQRVLLLEELRESEARFRQIADHLHEVIWLGDAALSRRLYINPAFESIWGIPRKRLFESPRPPLDAVHPEDRARVAAALPLLRHGTYDLEYRIVRPDGGVRWIWSRSHPIRNERGEVYRIAGIMEDVTEQKRAEEDRERLLASEQAARAESERRREELMRVTESRARIIRGFTHDVKNPLGAADGHAALLANGLVGALTHDQLESVHRIRRSIHTSIRLIDDLLAFAKAEAGQIEIVRTATDLALLLREAQQEYRAQADAKGLSLTLELPAEAPIVESDPNRIRQVVGNLLSNAVKYTRRGRITVRLRIPADDDACPGPGPWVAADVADTGPGIAPEQQRYLFHEFHRLDTSAETTGAGIGLAISQRIASALGGDVTVRSEVGRGSTFTLWLPLDPVGSRPGSASGDGVRRDGSRVG